MQSYTSPRQHTMFRERRSGSHVLDVHGLLWPAVCVQSEGVVIRTVDMRQHERLLVFGLGVQRSNVVSVCIVDNLAEKKTEGKVVKNRQSVHRSTRSSVYSLKFTVLKALNTYFLHLF